MQLTSELNRSYRHRHWRSWAARFRTIGIIQFTGRRPCTRKPSIFSQSELQQEGVCSQGISPRRPKSHRVPPCNHGGHFQWADRASLVWVDGVEIWTYDDEELLRILDALLIGGSRNVQT